MIVLIGGGVRSGKSAFALWRAQQLGPRRAFIATAQVFDDEMGDRVQRHRAERGDAFRTIEAPTDLVTVLTQIDDVDVVVIDCLTLWLSNLLLAGLSKDAIAARTDELARCLAAQRYHSVLVSNEVGLGIVPENALARAFRDVAGWAHQTLGGVADEIYMGLFGQMLRLRPSPVETVVFSR